MAKARKHIPLSLSVDTCCVRQNPFLSEVKVWTNEADVVHCKMLGETLKGRKKESYKDTLLYGLPSR